MVLMAMLASPSNMAGVAHNRGSDDPRLKSMSLDRKRLDGFPPKSTSPLLKPPQTFTTPVSGRGTVNVSALAKHIFCFPSAYQMMKKSVRDAHSLAGTW